jgi:hypothetical protein
MSELESSMKLPLEFKRTGIVSSRDRTAFLRCYRGFAALFAVRVRDRRAIRICPGNRNIAKSCKNYPLFLITSM